MLRNFAIALLAIAMSVGLAQAKGPRQRIPMCAEGQPATATCLCGVAVGGQPVLCQKGQWCHGWSFRGMRVCTP
jgi:hypothetical protein